MQVGKETGYYMILGSDRSSDNLKERNVMRFTIPVRILTTVMIGGLIVQFLGGMWVNLYGSVPSMTLGYATLWAAMGQMMAHGMSPVLMGQMMLGLFLLLLSVIIVATTALFGRRRWMVLATVGLLSVGVAEDGGLSFVLLGQHNSASLIMVVGWIEAFVDQLLYRKGYRPLDRAFSASKGHLSVV